MMNVVKNTLLCLMIVLACANHAATVEVELVNGARLQAVEILPDGQLNNIKRHSNSRQNEYYLTLTIGGRKRQIWTHSIARLRNSPDNPWTECAGPDVHQAPPPRIRAALQPAAEAIKPEGQWSWRGNVRGHYPASTAPNGFHVRWKKPMRSWTHSSPLIVGERVFTQDHPHFLHCLDKQTGKELWQRQNPGWLYAIDNGLPRTDFIWETYRLTGGTPSSDGRFLYVAYLHGIVACYDLAGDLQWVNQKRFGIHMRSGNIAGPCIVGETIMSSGYKPNSLVAYDRHTGQKIFSHGKGQEGKGAWQSITIDGVAYGVTPQGAIVDQSGAIRFNPKVRCYGPTPLVEDGIMVLRDLGKKSLLAYRIALDKDVETIWSHPFSCNVTPLIIDGIVHAFGTKQMHSFDLKTGTPLGSLAVKAAYSSPVLAGSDMVLVNNKEIVVINPGKQPSITMRIPHQFSFVNTGGSTFGSCPVFDGDLWYFRDKDHLWCLTARPETN